MQPQNTHNNFHHQLQDVPESLAILILGVVSIIISIVFPGLGVIPSIIALVKYKKAKKIYLENPNLFTKQSNDYLTIGQITGIIGLCISILIILSILVIIGFAIFITLYSEGAY